eukprot:TRINITY_DN8761_c0_g5_i1.p1 TRINITY_DN8761_c0_g5~~TRINITY_DN8761_c0_g5_i1.p1  ORF type:complete len:369 (+),score=41.81 TRINITY_DN8761_c0_g5_i1:385-1491(+)
MGVSLGPVVLVCGNRNTGKSTFSRFLVNHFLNRYEKVAFFDTDVGQTEFSPPGVVSIHVLDAPVVGPPFAHFHHPVCSRYFGAVTPSLDPVLYAQCVEETFSSFRNLLSTLPPTGNIPLIVNTHGWIKAIGLELLEQITSLVAPNFIVELKEKTKSKNVEFLLEHPQATCLATPMFDSTVDKNKKTAAELRLWALISYFGQRSRPLYELDLVNIAPALASQKPYKISFNSIRVQFLHQQVPEDQVWVSINGAIVGLCTQPDLESDSTDPLHKVNGSSVKTGTCLGLGIVRSIDLSRQLLYLLTPLPLSHLRHVTTLVKGTLDLPATLCFQSCPLHVDPYLAADCITASVGSKQKARKNLQRKRLTGAQ